MPWPGCAALACVLSPARERPREFSAGGAAGQLVAAAEAVAARDRGVQAGPVAGLVHAAGRAAADAEPGRPRHAYEHPAAGRNVDVELAVVRACDGGGRVGERLGGGQLVQVPVLVAPDLLQPRLPGGDDARPLHALPTPRCGPPATG